MSVLVELNQVASVFNGKTPAKSEKREVGHPVLKIKDVSDAGNFRGRYDSFVDIDLAEKHKDKWVQPGDTLILNAAHNADYVGSKTFFAISNVRGALPTGEWLLVRPDDQSLCPSYLHHWINNGNSRHQIRNLVKGIHLYPKDVARLKIPLPPLAEQKRIAAILDKADAIRKKRQQAIALTEDFLRSAFLEMFGDPVTNPKGWEVDSLNNLSAIMGGVTKGRKLDGKETAFVPYMRVANVQDGHLVLDDVTDIEVLPSDVEKYRLVKGDLLLTEGGDPDKLGRGAVWSGVIDPCIHQNHIFRVRANTDRILPDYLSTLVGGPRGKRYFLRAAKQTTGIATINMGQLKEFPCLIPPLSLQREWEALVMKTAASKERKVAAEQQQYDLFNSLVQRAFRGEL